MAVVKRCWRASCAFNVDGCFCDNDEVCISYYGECSDYIEQEYEPERMPQFKCKTCKNINCGNYKGYGDAQQL